MTRSVQPSGSAPEKGRCLTVVQLMPALESGGAERSTLEIARALVAAGHRSIVVSAGGRLVEHLEAEGSEHIRWISAASRCDAWQGRALRRMLRDRRPISCMRARGCRPGWPGGLARPGRAPSPPCTGSTRRVLQPIMLRGDRVIVVSQACATTSCATIPDSIGRGWWSSRAAWTRGVSLRLPPEAEWVARLLKRLPGGGRRC